MVFGILKIMIKEEWRLHTSLFGTRMFAAFPLMIGSGAFIATLFLPSIQTVMTTHQLLQSAHYVLILFGVTIGAFGLAGKEPESDGHDRPDHEEEEVVTRKR